MRGKRVSDDVHILHARHPSSQRQLRRRAIGNEAYASSGRSGQGEKMSKSVAHVTASDHLAGSHPHSILGFRAPAEKACQHNDLRGNQDSVGAIFAEFPIQIPF
jgi:hypothetical protein